MEKVLTDTKYEITPITMAVVAHVGKLGNNSSHVFETNDDFIVHQTPTKMIDLGCRFFGSTLKGRQEGTRGICGLTHKSPISIAPSSGMYFFPTASPTNPNCSWIAHSFIDQIYRSTNHQTELHFINGKKIVLNISYGSILNQIQRTAQFRYMLDNRLRGLNKFDVNPQTE